MPCRSWTFKIQHLAFNFDMWNGFQRRNRLSFPNKKRWQNQKIDSITFRCSTIIYILSIWILNMLFHSSWIYYSFWALLPKHSISKDICFLTIPNGPQRFTLKMSRKKKARTDLITFESKTSAIFFLCENRTMMFILFVHVGPFYSGSSSGFD